MPSLESTSGPVAATPAASPDSPAANEPARGGSLTLAYLTAPGGLSDKGLTITVRLRDDIRFQPPVDRLVTADDFKYSFERMMNPRSTPLAPATDFYLGVVGA